MSGDATEQLTTYLLRGLTRDEATKIRSMKAEHFEHSTRTGYGILVSKTEPPDPGCIARRLPGNNLDIVRGWLERNVVESLCDEFRRKRPGDAARSTAVAGWKQVRATRDELERQVDQLVKQKASLVDKIEELKMLEHLASEELLRTHGGTLIVIDGESWEVRRNRAGLHFERKT
jgi:hypothetical protein